MFRWGQEGGALLVWPAEARIAIFQSRIFAREALQTLNTDTGSDLRHGFINAELELPIELFRLREGRPSLNIVSVLQKGEWGIIMKLGVYFELDIWYW